MLELEAANDFIQHSTADGGIAHGLDQVHLKEARQFDGHR